MSKSWPGLRLLAPRSTLRPQLVLRVPHSPSATTACHVPQARYATTWAIALAYKMASVAVAAKTHGTMDMPQPVKRSCSPLKKRLVMRLQLGVLAKMRAPRPKWRPMRAKRCRETQSPWWTSDTPTMNDLVTDQRVFTGMQAQFKGEPVQIHTLFLRTGTIGTLSW